MENIGYGVVNFSTDNYWFDFTNSKFTVDVNYSLEGKQTPYIYGDYKDSNGNQQNLVYPYVKVYEEYLIKEGVASAKATLISYEQLNKLGCKIDDWTCSTSRYPWVYSTSYWTGSAYYAGYEMGILYNVGYDHGSHYDLYKLCGVRPVVNISTFSYSVPLWFYTGY